MRFGVATAAAATVMALGAGMLGVVAPGALTSALVPEAAAQPAPGSSAALPGNVAPAPGSSAPVPLPQDDPFYHYDGAAPLESLANGEPLRQRESQVHVAGVPTPLRMTQVLYRTTDAAGRAHATATSIVHPAQPNGRVISYQSAYDSLAPDCQPSYVMAGGFDRGMISTSEIGLIAPLVALGYTVITSDFEGQDPHFANGVTYGHGTLDAIRAATRTPGSGVTTDSPIVLAGYSGGAIATQWAAELAPEYAPDVNEQLLGAAAGGLLVEPLRNLEYVDGSLLWKAVIPMAVAGIARGYEVDLDPYLTERGKEVFAKAETSCILPQFFDELLHQQGVTWDDLVLPEYRDPRDFDLLQDLGGRMVMGTHGTPTIPLFLRQGGGGWIEGTDGTRPGIGAGDGVMLLDDGRDLARDYCDRGVTVDYAGYPDLSHVLSAPVFMAEAVPWIDARFAGAPAPANCGRF